jgi:LPS-assembly lipoprotein
MWSPEAGARPFASSGRKIGRRILLAGIVAGLPLLAACQVRPLLATPPAGTGVGADLSSIAIKPVETRYAQEVRNHLIFLFNGGSGQTAAARYGLQLSVTQIRETTAEVEVADENEPSAAMITMIASYVLTDRQAVNKDVPAEGTVIATGNRQIAASYDVPLQEFAALRAERDAENRAARELAELLRLAIAQDLNRISR